MKLIGAFLFVVISNCVVGQNADPFLKVFPIKITCLEIPLDSIVKISANESRTSESKKIEKPYSMTSYRSEATTYYVEGIKIKDPPFILNGNRNKMYSYLDIQRMPKEENLFKSLWLK